MEDRNRNTEQSDNQKHVEVLRRLLNIVEVQEKMEYAEALKAGIKALGDQDSSGSDDITLSGPASKQLLQMAEEVRNGTENRANAAAQLAFLAGHR